MRFNVCNESPDERNVTVKWSLKNIDGKTKTHFEKEVTVPPLSAVWMERVELQEADLYSDYVVYELAENEVVISKETLIFL